MKKIRILSIIIFLTAITTFGLYKRVGQVNRDRKGPEITMDNEEIEVSCSAAREDLLAGIKAIDNRDGDVSGTLLVETMSNFIEKGRRKITVAAFDSSNNVTKATRTVIYTDYHSTRFSLEEPLSFPLKTEEILGTLSAEDVLDGDLTGNIKISSEYSVKEDEEGIYPMEFYVSNSAGDVTKLPVNIEIYDPSKSARNPQFELSEYLVYTTPGTALNAWDYVQKMVVNGIEFVRGQDGVLYDPKPKENQKRVSITPEEVIIDQNVDYNTPGTYEIIYHFTDPEDSDEKEGHVRLIVIVSE